MRSRLYGAMVDGRALVLVVVVGGMLVLRSSNNLDPSKVAYLLLVAASLAGAVVSLRWWLSGQRAVIATPWLISAGAFAALLILSLAVSRAHNTPISSWLRDASAYALFAAAPIYGLACARSASRRWIIALLVVCALLTSVSLVIDWLGRRLILDLVFDRIVLPTVGLGTALIALATALALAGAWRRWWWATLAGVVFGLFFVTGTRSWLLFLLIPIGAGLIAGRPWRRAAGALMIETMVAVAIFFVGATGTSLANGTLQLNLWPSTATASASPSLTASPSASLSPKATPKPTPKPTVPPGQLTERLGGVGTLLTDPGSDQSFQDRWAETKAAWQAFLTSPLVGVGPGYDFTWTDSKSKPRSAFTMDTPLIYLAKFGLVGLFALVAFLAAYLRLFLTLRRRPGARIEYLTIGAYGVALLVATAFWSPMEDKGISFAMIFLVGFACRALIQGGQGDTSPGLPREDGDKVVPSITEGATE